MGAFLKSLLSGVIGGIVTGSVPAAQGSDVKSIAASAAVGVIVALANLWIHKPGTEPAK